MSAELPTHAGFYWHRHNEDEPWKIVRIKAFGSGGIRDLCAYDAEDSLWGGWSLEFWKHNRPIGEWVEIKTPMSKG